MSDTYTGTLDPNSFTSAIGQLFPDNDNRQGTLVEIDALPSGASVDNIFFFNGTTSGQYFRRVFDGPLRASQCGIYPGGADMTAALNNALSNMLTYDITTIVFDYTEPSVIAIDGAVTVPAGKTLEFKGRNMLGGTGSLTGGIIDAPDETQIFDLSNGFDPSPVKTAKSYWSVKWWGAKGDATVDDHAAIQYACSYMCKSWGLLNSNELYFPTGKYIISAPIILSNPVSNRWNNFTMKMSGRQGTSSFGREGATAWISCDFGEADRSFAIGIQNGNKVCITGFFIEGEFAPSMATTQGGTFKQFYETRFEDYSDGSPDATDNPATDRRYSPYAGIVVDPFTQNGTLPPDDGYEDLTAQYEYASAGNTFTGSTGIHLEDLRIHNFVVGVLVSPSGVGRGCEGFKFDQITIGICKVGFACCHDQTKENVIRQVICWYDTHTIFDNVTYGELRGTAFYIDGANIAGTVVRIFNIWNAGYFDCHITKIFAESILSIGVIDGTPGCSIQDSCFDLLIGGNPYADTPTYDHHGFFRNVHIKSCTFRRYGSFTRLHFFSAGSTFENCYFERPPYIIDRADVPNNTEFINCNALTSYINPPNTKTDLLQGFIRNTYLKGDRTYELAALAGGVNVKLKYSSTTYESYNRITSGGTINLTVNTTNWSATFNTDLPNSIFPDDLIVLQVGHYRTSFDTEDRFVPGLRVLQQAVVGIVNTVNTGTGDVTLKFVPCNMATGTYTAVAARPIGIGNPFIGDVSNASNVITNVEPLFTGSYPEVGTQIVFPCTDIFVLGPSYARVTAVNTGSKTITVDRNAFYTGNGIAFVNYVPDVEYIIREYLTTNAANTIFSDGNPFPIGASIKYHYNPSFDAAPNDLFLANFEVIKSGWTAPNGTTKLHAGAIRRVGEGYSHAVTSNYTMKGYEDIVEINASGGNVTVTLMDNKVDHYNKQFTFIRKDNSGNTVTIAAGAGDNISGNASIALASQYAIARILFKADGNHFQI